METRIEGKEGAWTGRERVVEGAGEERVQAEREKEVSRKL